MPSTSTKDYGLLGISVLALLLCAAKLAAALIYWKTSLIGLHASYAEKPLLFIGVGAFWAVAAASAFYGVMSSIAAYGTRRKDVKASS